MDLDCNMTSIVENLPPRLTRSEIAVGDDLRDFYVYTPSGDPPTSGWPVVLALHGSGTDARFMYHFCGLHHTAEAERFVVVYPNGTGRVMAARGWNAGDKVGYAARQGVDDLRFFDHLLNHLTTRYPVDPNRVYAAGMSNGGMMCFRLAVELAGRFAAIASVAGTMLRLENSPTVPTPLVHIHGTHDQYVLYQGGPGPKSLARGDYPSVAETVRTWVEVNGANPHAVTEALPLMVEDGTHVERTQHTKQTDQGAEVLLYTIHGGGHTWPGQYQGPDYLGPVSGNLDTNWAIWEFFVASAK